MSDHKRAGLLVDALPPARELIADRGYDSAGFRAALEDLGITPCILSRKHPIRMTQLSTASITRSRTLKLKLSCFRGVVFAWMITVLR